MTIEITLLGTFEVRRDGAAVPASAWSRRHAAALVKLLALSPGRRLHREQVIDALWPDLAVDEAAPRLHKAAHFARKAAGDDTIVLRGESVALFPDQSVAVDVALFEAAADEALRAGDEALLQAASDRCGGDLLPEDLYEEWADGPRQRVRQLRTDLLRRLRRWDDLVQLDRDRRRGPSRAHARPAGPGRPARGAAPVRAARPGLGRRAGCGAQQGGDRLARRPPRRRSGRARAHRRG